MITVKVGAEDVLISEEKLDHIQVVSEKRRGKGDRKWGIVFSYSDGEEKYMVYDCYLDAAVDMYRISKELEKILVWL